MKRHKPIKIQTPIKVVVKEEAEKKNKNEQHVEQKINILLTGKQTAMYLLVSHYPY